MILSDMDKIYTGITTDPVRRYKEHKTKKKGANFFKFCTPLKFIYIEETFSRSSALKREAQIKNMNKKRKVALSLEESKANYFNDFLFK